MYLPVYPSDPASKFNELFFNKAPNSLHELMPDLAEFESMAHLIDIKQWSEGLYAHILADPAAHKAICFLDVACS
jgi:hypothetical protein